MEPPLPTVGGGGDINRRGGRNEDIRRTASVGRGGGVLSGTGDRTAQSIWMSSGTGASSLTEVVELPLSKAGGGGGEVHGGSGGSQAALNERRGKDFSPTQWATGCCKHRSRESSHECSPGRHAFQQAKNAFGPDESPGRYTYGGGRVPGTVIDLGSGRTSGQ